MLLVKSLSKEDDWICSNGQWIKHGNPRESAPTKPCPKNTSPSSTPQPVDQEQNIVLTKPQPESIITTTVTLQGRARVFENQFNYRVKDANGKVLGSGNIIASAKEVGDFGPFNQSISFLKSQTKTGTLEVYDNSVKDGSEIDNVIITVRFY